MTYIYLAGDNMLKINSEYQKGILFVRINGNLNRRTSSKLNNFLVPAILKHKIKYLVYNLYNLDSIDFIGIEALKKSARAIKVNHGISLICEIPENLKNSFENIDIKKTTNELAAIKLINI